jgi:metal-dependent amidase/aminoacylase/carboxypeptidase family protein
LRDVFAAGLVGPKGLDEGLALVLRNGGELEKWKPRERSSERRRSRIHRRSWAGRISVFQQKASGIFFSVGARNEEEGITYPHHHPRFTIDEGSLENGVRLFVHATFGLLEAETGAGA